MIHGLYNISVALSDIAKVPTKAHQDDAAFDLCALDGGWVYPGETTFFDTGVSVEIPEDCAGLVLPRSGLSTREGLIIPNAPGLIDPGYRGNIRVGLHKLMRPDDVRAIVGGFGENAYFVADGDRIAQLLIVPLVSVLLTVQSTLSESVRGSGGFGSTGN